MTEQERSKLKKLMALTTSENDGEALNALRAANRILARNDLSWEDLLISPPTSTYFSERSETRPKKRPFYEDVFRQAQEAADRWDDAQEAVRQHNEEVIKRFRNGGYW